MIVTGSLTRESLPISSQRPEHLFDAVLLLFYVGVDIEVHCRTDVGVSQKGAYGLVVALAFYASGCKTVAQSLELQFRQA